MSLVLILVLLTALAFTVPFLGADTRYPGAGARPDRPSRGKRYRRSWHSATTTTARRDQFGRTS
ncbi:hypothetical protein [Kineococcus sp. SYSU DK002]|uniref:hypothetical protein n=1 Tax=Kineococcus sp. SYSU DK002 TaxID=3383123 RepID=UPI003D7E9CA8